jgi:hypothetical protein
MVHLESKGERPRLIGERFLGERRPGLRAVGSAAARIAGPVVKRRGGAILVRLKVDWRVISGDGLAAHTWPTALSRDGVLRMRAAAAVALELQHRLPLLIERINLFFGRCVVARIVLVQGPLPIATALPAESDVPGDSRETAIEAVLAVQLAEIADPELRAALAGFGRLVLGGDNRRQEAGVAPPPTKG